MVKTKIYGHRGSKGEYPENTLISFQHAISKGVEGIELDVHLTKDNELVVIHDERLDRTTDGEGFVKDLCLKQIKECSAGIKFSHLQHYQEGWDREKVPTLQEVFELLKPYKTELNIELKTYLVDYNGIEKKVLDLVNEYGNKRKVVYSSFHLPTLLRIKDLDKNANIAWLLQQPVPHPEDYLNSLGLEALHINKTIVLENETHWKDVRQSIRAWTVNDQSEIEGLLALEIEAIITDFPALALSLRDA